MPAFDRRAVAWLRDHHATISSAEMDAAGITLDQRKLLVSSGVLTRVVDGCYRFTGVDADDERARCAALCTSRPHLVVSGPTASRLWSLRRSPRDGLVHVIAPPHSHPCREPWVRAFRTGTLSDDEIVQRPDGIRLTSPPRTVVDMTRYVGDVALGLAARGCSCPGSVHHCDAPAHGPTAGHPGPSLGTPLPPPARLPGTGGTGRVGVGASRGRRAAAAGLRRSGSPVRGAASRLRPGPARHGNCRAALGVGDRRPSRAQNSRRDGAGHRRDDAADAMGWFVRRVSEVQLVRPIRRHHRHGPRLHRASPPAHDR